VRNLTLSRIYGSNALIVWDYAVSCYDVITAIITYKSVSGVEREVRLPAGSRSYELEGLAPITCYVINVSVVYEGGIHSEATSLPFNSGGLGKYDLSVRCFVFYFSVGRSVGLSV